jgi:hypothetical protein
VSIFVNFNHLQLMHIVKCLITSWLNSQLHVYTTFSLFVYLLMDIQIAFLIWLLWVMLLQALIYGFDIKEKVVSELRSVPPLLFVQINIQIICMVSVSIL